MITGSIVALVTPMANNGDIDWVALDKLVEFHIENGTSSIVAVGTSGESATLNPEEHCAVIKRVVEVVAKRIPVIAGTGANNTQEAIELSIEAKAAGADADRPAADLHPRRLHRPDRRHAVPLGREPDRLGHDAAHHRGAGRVGRAGPAPRGGFRGRLLRPVYRCRAAHRASETDAGGIVLPQMTCSPDRVRPCRRSRYR